MAYPQVGGNGTKDKLKEAEKEEDGALTTAVAVGVAAVAVGVAAVGLWGLSKLFGGSNKEEKMMKAPGKDYFIPRKDFESNPADWFRNHRFD